MSHHPAFFKFASFAFIGIACLVAPLSEAAPPGQTPLSSSMILNEFFDYRNCTNQLEKAKALGNRKIHINYFVNVLLDSQNRFRHMCIVDETLQCQKATDYHFDTIRYFFGRCLRKAVELDLAISITPYIEHKTDGENFWRNYFYMDPTEKIDRFSYEEATLNVILESIENNTPETYPIELSLQGEMGGSVAAAPGEYLRILKKTKKRFSSREMKIGISLNFDDIFGGYPKMNQNLPAINELMRHLDFIGISLYKDVEVPAKVQNFRDNLDFFFQSIKKSGVKVPAMLPLRITEVGLGGGQPTGFDVPAVTPAQAAKNPWSGVRGFYNFSNDPWQKQDMRAYRQDFHMALLKFLAKPDISRPIIGAYLWNQESWDVQGFGYGFEEYGDPDVIELIKRYNSRIQ